MKYVSITLVIVLTLWFGVSQGYKYGYKDGRAGLPKTMDIKILNDEEKRQAHFDREMAKLLNTD